jgi:Holliday junction resolvase RusA-like endonuclease
MRYSGDSKVDATFHGGPIDVHTIALPLNPEPWTAPSISVGRRGGKPFPMVYKNEALRSYQEAVKELLPTHIWVEPPIHLEFYFWRQLPDYTTDKDVRARKHHADATNMQKALEDALQGVLFKNDKDVRSIRSWVMDQGKDVDPMVGIIIRRSGAVPDVEHSFRSLIMDDEPPADRETFEHTEGMF